MCARPSSTNLLALVVWVLLSGCATSRVPTRLVSGHGHRSLVPPLSSDSRPGRGVSTAALLEVPGSAGGIFGRELDAFQAVQEACGLEEEARHPAGAALYLEQARQLLSRLAKTPVTQKSFGPRLVLSWLLRETLTGGERVEYAELGRRTERFWPLVLVRPDGYLVTALSGQPMLDGAQDAVGEMAVALAQSVLHPIRGAEDLSQLPTTVALLIASSPEYFQRYGAMSLQDQIREAARLATHLLMMYGSSAGTVGTVGRAGALGAELPVLAVSADGLLVVRTVAVSAGTVTTTLEAGVGALSVLHMAAGSGSWPPIGGPGGWVQDTSSMSEEARTYQAQVTGAPKGWAYEVCRNGRCVKYDGYDPKEGTLLEAKGEGYDNAAYWGCRPESAQECARRAETFFRLLSGCDPTYARWYEKNNSLERALQLQFEPTFDTFVRFFGQKKYQVWDDEGFSFGAWTGHVEEDRGGMITLSCGLRAEVAPNNVLLYFPSDGPELERLLTLPVLMGVMRAMALAWEPDWAVTISDDFRDRLSQQGSAGTFVGWLTYFSRQWGEVPALPEPARVEPVEDKGTLVILGPERLGAANPEHVSLGSRVQQVFEEHGLLRRLLSQPNPSK